MQSSVTDMQVSTLNKTTQRRMVWTYRTLFVLQLVTGIGIIISSSLAFIFEYGKGGVPYYTGGYAIGALLVVSSAMAFRVWYRVPEINVNAKARMDALCAINCHRLTSLCMFFVCIIGLSIVLMFGLCLQEQSDCSYEEDTANGHKTVSTVISVFGFIGLVTSSIGIMLIRQFESAFGIGHYGPRQRIPNPDRRNIAMVAVVDTGNIQDPETQRQRDSHLQQELQLSPFSALTHVTEGATSSAFGLPQLPPYSPPEKAKVRIGDQSDGNTGSGHQLTIHVYGHEGDNTFTNQWIGPLATSYSVDGNIQTHAITGSFNGVSNTLIPSDPPPPYTFNVTVQNDMANQTL